MRNIMATVPKKQKEAFGAELKKIWQAESKKDAFVEKYADKYDKAVECLEEGFEDSIQYYGFSKLDSRKISSTNTLERLNKEVRRRSRAVGIFPSTESYLRLMTASLIEYSEDHLTGASYISADTLREQKIEWDKEQKAAWFAWLFSKKFRTILDAINIKEEESNSAKTSNYAIYKKTLSEAESLLKELNNPFVENNSASYFELKLQELQNPIY